jgi:hypothetical protein
VDKASASGAGDRGFKSRIGCPFFGFKLVGYQPLVPDETNLEFERNKVHAIFFGRLLETVFGSGKN